MLKSAAKMSSLSHGNFRQEVQSLHSSVIRARVQMCRKLITDIKKLSKKKTDNQCKNEKNSRKIQRLTKEVHVLKSLKPNFISEFALSHTADSAIILRDQPEETSSIKALAKISLHKLIKPLVEKFHKKYPDWQEILPKVINKKLGENKITESNIKKNNTSEGSIAFNDDEMVDTDDSASENTETSSEYVKSLRTEVRVDTKAFVHSKLANKTENVPFSKHSTSKRKICSNHISKTLQRKKYCLKTTNKRPNVGILSNKWEVVDLMDSVSEKKHNGDEQPINLEDNQLVEKCNEQKNLSCYNEESINTDEESTGESECGKFSENEHLLYKDEESNKVVNVNRKKSIVKVEKLNASRKQHEDPFFLTKDNKKYLTFGKITDESKIEPLLAKQKSYNCTKSWKEKTAFTNIQEMGKDGNKKFGRVSSTSEDNVKLHPSWEAKKRITTILPFQGKKISFDN